MAEHSAMPGRRRWRRWVAWAILLVICGGLILADAALNLDTVRRQRAWQAERRAYVVRAQEVRWLLMNRIEPALGGSVEALEGQWRLDGVRKVSLGTGSHRYVVPGEHFHEDAAGFTAQLSFTNDRLTGFSITPPPGPPRPTLTAWVYFHRATIGLALRRRARG